MPLFPQKQLPARNSKQAAQQAQQLNAKLAKIQVEYKKALADEQFQIAIDHVKSALKLLPNHPKVLGDLAFAYLRGQQFQQAYDTYHKAIKVNSGIDTNLYDGLTEACWYLNKLDEMKVNGQKALQSKIDQVKQKPALAIPNQLPPPLSTDKTRNIIAFSLFGGNPRYCETAILNIEAAKELLPEWTCRFYCDQSVPQHVRDRLSQGGQVVMVSDEIQGKISGLMWRFLVMDDSSVDRFLCRDADSLISTREQYAVNEWIKSDKWFHIMRDYATHTELILAGMWGGCHGVFKNLPHMMEDFIKSGEFLGQRVLDQHFLRHVIWPTIQHNLYHHDSVFDMPGSHPFPAHPVRPGYEQYPRFHVGTNVGEATITEQTTHPEGASVDWSVLDQQKQPVCVYQAKVKNGQIKILIPRPYADRMGVNEWSIMIDGKLIEKVLLSEA